ncbi:extracellular solute-binding protein [Nonomuraea sp. NPDC003804]|uniref:extracellular solute-binding protein n=1 Tax=Nonomuraea sp. NPDC003804 TaxID=3154547 RepID=UPI0033BB4653
MSSSRRALGLLIVTGLSLSVAACGSTPDEPAPAASGTAQAAPVTISVGCQPPKTNPLQRKDWDDDVAAFQKLHPNITVDSKDGFPCHDVKTYDAKLAGGQMEDLFYGYFGDVQTAIKAGQAADITAYVDTVSTLKDIDPSVMAAYTVNGRTYGVPRGNYKVGLVYNRKLFTQAGLDPNTPPKSWAEIREAATLMIPPMVLILPLYVTVVDLDLLNTPWAIWLPAAANGFNIFLLKRFFDSVPRELIEAAEMDGASPARILWSIVLPVSRPILGVVSIFTVVNVWRDFVYPLLVLPDTDRMTVSVAINSLSQTMPTNALTAALVIASLPTIVIFLFFQRHIMAGLTAGSLKG